METTELTFGILIHKNVHESGITQELFESKNDGIPTEEVLTKIQTWLDIEKEKYKNDFRENTS